MLDKQLVVRSYLEAALKASVTTIVKQVRFVQASAKELNKHLKNVTRVCLCSSRVVVIVIAKLQCLDLQQVCDLALSVS